jgi:Helix-turn-helix domain
MPREENSRNYSALSVQDVAELLGITDRQVRNLIKDKGLPAKSDPRGFTLDWPTALEWYVGYRSAQKGGNRGNFRPGSGSEELDETLDEAILRKTKAEADLKELILARERSEVAAIADVEKALGAANAATKRLIQALPSRLATQLLGIDDRPRMYAILERESNALLSNLASVGSVLEVSSSRPAPDDDEDA